MTKLSINRKQLLGFLSEFGKAEDLRIHFDDKSMTASVAFISHYITKTREVDGEVKENGNLDITELVKVRQFLKAAKDDVVNISQTGSAKTLNITCGSSKISMPTSSTIVSAAKASLFEKLIEEAEASEWTKFHSCDLSVSGVITLDELATVSKMRGILNSSPIFKITANPSENEFLISSGKRHETKLFTTLELRDSTGPVTGSVSSTYGSWLMDSIALLGGGEATIHIGEATIIALEKDEDLLVIVDQRA